jgi:hypothetical protein
LLARKTQPIPERSGQRNFEGEGRRRRRSNDDDDNKFTRRTYTRATDKATRESAATRGGGGGMQQEQLAFRYYNLKFCVALGNFRGATLLDSSQQ